MKSLFTIEETNELIRAGKCLMIAADEKLLAKLVTGNWIGGTIPYFMGDDGGAVRFDVLQVTQMPSEAVPREIRNYSVSDIESIPTHYPTNGFSQIIMPGTSAIQRVFAEKCSSWPGLFTRPLVGWVSGRHLDSNDIPKVINGTTGKFSIDEAVVIHFDLPETKFARVHIINLFEEGEGDIITFPERGFDVTACFVNGVPTNFAEFFTSRKRDPSLPLVADFYGAKINVCVESADAVSKKTRLAAPVFPGVTYRFAKPVADYEEEFAKLISDHAPDPIFMCNCVFNYVYAKLENKKTGPLKGPMTFGEIAYMLLNQTMVYLTLEEVAARQVS
ncbi:hypothetical protein BH10BDE1_BH10BDE1_02050 [soil metagenome]